MLFFHSVTPGAIPADLFQFYPAPLSGKLGRMQVYAMPTQGQVIVSQPVESAAAIGATTGAWVSESLPAAPTWSLQPPATDDFF
jgi:hypothetical protein